MNTIATEMLHTKRIMALLVWSSIIAICTSFSLYVYLINKTVFNVVARQTAEQQISDLNTKVSDMEFKSMALRGTVSLELAHSLGFSEVTDINFLSQKTPAKSLSFNHVE